MGHMFSADWFSPNRWQFEQHTKDMKLDDYRLLEIGSFEGRSTCWLLNRFPKAHLTCIDAIEQAVFWQNIKASGGEGRVTLHIGHSRDLIPTLPSNSYDFIYIDGGHGTVDVLEDAVLSFRRAKVGAVIGFDDYLWGDAKIEARGTPKAAVDAFLAIYKNKVSVLAKNYQVWLKKIDD